MNYLEDHYSNYNEDERLLSQHGQVEYITTMTYIHKYLERMKEQGTVEKPRILELGAGTGRYSLALAEEGYLVDAVELTEHNLEILRSKITEQLQITASQGNALDLSHFADNTYDLTLVLGPMYHLYTEEDRMQALREAVRVTRPGGYILAAYCMNESVVIQYEFWEGHIKEDLATGKLSADYHCLSEPEDLFVMMRKEEIEAMTAQLPVERQALIATDGATVYLRDMVDAMDQETFGRWVEYHLLTCERQDLIGATNHSLDILRKIV
ncbi:MAG: class I SAM-dependent methyltransferase [Acetatifactor sp.]|nr:class I SAM-dependent methyltransferase [Acetatifactor sp.]